MNLAALTRAWFRFTQGRRYRRFLHDLTRPAEAQARTLSELVARLARTEYGRRHGVDGSETYAEFAARLPIVGYEDLEPWIARQQQNEKRRTISPDPVRLYEKTSGSSGARKYIPYTQPFLDACQHYFLLWAYDLLVRGPRFETGKMFFSVSPAFQEERATEAGVPVSLDDDTEYLSPGLRRLLAPFFVVPHGLKQVKRPFEYRLVLACALVAEPDLEIISIWNPTYLTALLEFVVENRERVLAILRHGSLEVAGRTFRFQRLDGEREKLLLEPRVQWARVWPRLKLISCWTDAGAATFASALWEHFPRVLMQGKGLLATETPMTLPLLTDAGPVPLLDRIFFEFQHEGAKPVLLHQLERGKRYSIILTQASGFTRYRIGDQVEVCGFHDSTPCLRFIGREGASTDLVGEKLSEPFVREALRRALPAGSTAFAYLVPQREPKPHYTCVTDRAGDELQASLERELSRAFHYKQARLLGQLGPVELRVRADANRLYHDHFIVNRGMKWGDVKYSALVKDAPVT